MRGLEREKTHPTWAKLACDWAFDWIFQPKVTPLGNVHCCGPPSQMWNDSGVLEDDMKHVSL